MATKSTLTLGTTVFQSAPRTVEVAPQPATAKVVRDGFQVPAVTLNPRATVIFLGELEVVQARQTPRVVSQSIAPGTRVTAGTVVDLILAPVNDIPFGIFQGVHRDLATRKIGPLLDGILAQPVTRQAVLKYQSADDVPAADRTLLTAAFRQADIGVDEASAETNFAAAFNGARAALAFK